MALRRMSLAPNRIHDGRWNLERSHWNRTRHDRDGIPNNRDAHPDNPNRR